MSQEFDSDVLNLVMQRGFYPYENMNDFEKFKERLPSKEMFYSSLAGKKTSHKGYEHVLKVWDTFEMKAKKDYHELYLKCDALLLADVFEKFRNGSKKNDDKDGKALHELINNAEYGKTMGKLRNRTDVRLVSNEKDYLKWTSKQSHVTKNI